jgi:type II secretory pathway pseudopilin PulG
MSGKHQRGTALMELMVSMAIMGLILTMSCAAFVTMYRRAALRAGAQRVRGILQQTRLSSSLLSANCAVKFIQRSGGWSYAVYQDGNGDGVTNSDIAKGVDPAMSGEMPLVNEFGVRVGLLANESDPDGGPPLTSPVNFNRSTLCSFSQTGSGTPGTVYLTNGSGAIAIRTADDGRIRILVYVPESARWEELK